MVMSVMCKDPFNPGPIFSHAIMTCVALVQLAVLVLARPWYARHRVPLQAALRLMRVGTHAWHSISSNSDGQWWVRKLLSEDPSRALKSSFMALPIAFLQQALLYPCPMTMQPYFAATLLVIYLRGWMQLGATIVWQAPNMAGAVAALCRRIHKALLIVNSLSYAAFG